GNAEGVSALLQANASVDLPKAMLLALKHGHVEVVGVLDNWSKQQAGNPSEGSRRARCCVSADLTRAILTGG
ncbi:hypothetical protein FGF82_23905, partial [Salmonella sp. gx-f9]|nr:hypothetical protein [Salmonella sp. gx-f9]